MSLSAVVAIIIFQGDCICHHDYSGQNGNESFFFFFICCTPERAQGYAFIGTIIEYNQSINKWSVPPHFLPLLGGPNPRSEPVQVVVAW